MALYLGSKKVCPTKIITKEVSSMKPFFDAGGKCAYSTATSFEGAIQFSDTSNVTDMNNMFSKCSSLTSIPQLDTSKVTSMKSMFSDCSSLTSIPQLDTSKVTNMYNMFFYCSRLTTIPQLDTSNVTNMYNMFYSCSKLSNIPQLNTSNVTSMNSMFSSCSRLTTIPQLDTSNVTSMNNMFSYCGSLTTIHMINMKVNFDISSSTKFTREALVEIINNCYDLTTLNKTASLTMGPTNLAKLTDEDKLIATNKGRTLA